MSAKIFAAIAALGLAVPAATQPLPPRPGASRNIAAACAGRDGWADPAPPARVFGATYFVGTCGITALLVETPMGLVLVDGGVPEAAPLVLANIRKLGFSPRQVRWIVSSHEHFDHVGALAAIQHATGAEVVAGTWQAALLRSGQPAADDPQAPTLKPFAGLRVERELASGASIVLGGTVFTVTATPAHSPGSASWSWRTCEGAVCRTVAYADSVTAISADGYRFADHPVRVSAVRAGLMAVAALPCDVLVTPHPAASDLLPRLSGTAPLFDPAACRAYAAAAGARFDKRLAEEAGK